MINNSNDRVFFEFEEARGVFDKQAGSFIFDLGDGRHFMISIQHIVDNFLKFESFEDRISKLEKQREIIIEL